MSAVPRTGQLPIGQKLTRGLGAGGNPDIGQARSHACTAGSKHAERAGLARARAHAATLRPRCAQKAAQESVTALEQALAGADMVFVTARAHAH